MNLFAAWRSPKRCTTRRKHLCWEGSDRKINSRPGAAPLSLVHRIRGERYPKRGSCRLKGHPAPRSVHGIDRRRLKGTAMQSFLASSDGVRGWCPALARAGKAPVSKSSLLGRVVVSIDCCWLLRAGGRAVAPQDIPISINFGPFMFLAFAAFLPCCGAVEQGGNNQNL